MLLDGVLDKNPDSQKGTSYWVKYEQRGNCLRHIASRRNLKGLTKNFTTLFTFRLKYSWVICRGFFRNYITYYCIRPQVQWPWNSAASTKQWVQRFGKRILAKANAMNLPESEFADENDRNRGGVIWQMICIWEKQTFSV
jgi:hypothetical protein